MSIQVAQRMSLIQPSATLAITAKAKELQAAGRDLVSFGAGEPDFDTPQHIKAAAKRAIDEGQTKYTATGGTPTLKQAICTKFQRDNALEYTPKQVMAANGGKHILYNIFVTTLNPGDEVIVPIPSWVSYPDQLRLAGAKVVQVFCGIEDNYLLTAEKLDTIITERTRMLVINSPSNPTGLAYTKEELIALGKVLMKYPQVMIVSDDIYEHIIYDDLVFYNLPMLFPELKERCFLVNGVSKAYSMTGWRIGFCAAGSEAVISAMEKLQGQCTSNPCSIAQAAAVAALEQPQDCVKEMCKAFLERRDLVYRMLCSMPGVKTALPRGAFYIFPDLSEVYQTKHFQDILQKSNSDSLSQTFCSHLLEHYEVAAVPGVAFGNDQAIRISYALGEEQLRKGLERIGNMISGLVE